MTTNDMHTHLLAHILVTLYWKLGLDLAIILLINAI